MQAGSLHAFASVTASSIRLWILHGLAALRAYYRAPVIVTPGTPRQSAFPAAAQANVPPTSAANHMKASDRFDPVGALATLIVSTMLAVPHPAAAQANAIRADRKAFVRPGYTVAYPPYLYPGACLYGACGAMWWIDRRPLRRPIAPDQAEPAEQDIWGTTGSPWGYVRRLPPPTPESRIQPLYRDASTIRPEFSERDSASPD